MQSMTGYSRVVRRLKRGSITVSIRSTNHRYLEISHRLPEGFSAFEAHLSHLIRGRIKRGRIEISVTIQGQGASSRKVVSIDEALAKAYYEKLSGLRSKLGIKSEISVEQLLSLPHVMSFTEEEASRQALWSDVRRAIDESIKALIATRKAEGTRLIKDIKSQSALIKNRVSSIKSRLPKAQAEQKKRFQEKVKSILGGPASLNSSQIQEAVALIRETDINEEVIRLQSHLTHLFGVISAGDSVGKKLDFIAQELTREANTIGAKANDYLIARFVVDIKGAIEKIREQSQNLE
jgi:uncharacterized protein (TIGR00255 family)